MAQEIKLTMDGMLLNWLKDVGDSVSAGDIVAEFEADKATVEVEAPADGVILELKAEIGDQMSEGDVIALLGEAGEKAESNGKAKSDDKPKEETREEPDASDGEAEAEAEEEAQATAASNGATRTEDGRIKASPLARRIAEDRGIDLSQVSGSGPGGRIVKADVESFKPGEAKAPGKEKDAAAPAPSAQSYGKLPEGDDVEIIEMSRMRKAIAKGTITSAQTTPHFFVTIEIDVEPLLTLRKQLNADLEADGIKISVNDMIVKAVALTLRKFPNLNSHYYGDKIVRHKRFNVAIAVALPDNGLVNVVSPDADKTTLSAMAQYHAKVFNEVRDGKIRPEYIQGGTFLVSNLGAYDVEAFSSIIDPPQSGALAVGSARKVPVVKEDGTLGVGSRMKVTLSIDHRVSDGAEGAQWLNHLRDLLENPMRLLV